MSVEDNPRRPLDGILEGLAESIASEDPNELLEEARVSRRDSKMIAETLKTAMRDALKKLEQRKLEFAREKYRSRSAGGLRASHQIASTPQGRKQQLLRLLKGNPEIGAALTAQYREFEGAPDEDVTSALEDLAELGLPLVPEASNEE
jgi:hypothetical protein